MTHPRIAAQPPTAQTLVAQTLAARPRRPTLHLGSKPAAPIAPDAPPAIAVVPSAPRLFPLDRLKRADENVRHLRIDDGCDALADDITAHGLLQSLIGYEMDGAVEIVGGGRRLKALRIVKARGLIDGSFEVPVLIRDVDDAVELSLAENLQQKAMSPVDEFLAFATLMQRGNTSPAELGRRFGYSEAVVKQRLRLAQLAPPVLDALAERQITLDAAMAYASSQDATLQAEVFQTQAKRGRGAHDPAGIRHSLRMKGIDTADRLFRFVGAELYEREGGTYEDDLFREAGKERVLAQPFVLETIAERMVDFQAARLVEKLRVDEAWSPAITGFVKAPGLALHRWGTDRPMRPPAGFVLVEREEPDRLWRTIRTNGFNVHVVVGLDEEGRLVPARRYAFVPLAQKTAVERPTLADAAVDQEKAAIAAREREIIRWSRRLAVPPTAGTPLEGRVFWIENDQERALRHRIGDEEGFLLPMSVFVSDAAIAAHRREAIARVDQRQAAKGEA